MNDNRWTEKAQNALRHAYEAASELGHNYVGSEHILLGILRENTGLAAKLLQGAGVSNESLTMTIIASVGQGAPGGQPVGMTPHSKEIMEIAAEEAVSHNSGYIGTEHMLMALIREGDNYALRILQALGADTRKLYRTLEQQSAGATHEHATSGNTAAKPKDLKVMSKYGVDLTQKAREGKLDPIIGRDSEIERVIQILSRRQKNNPALIGEPGVGKTAIAEGLAQKIVAGDVPETIANKRLITLDLTGMVAGTKYRGEFEERIKSAIDEVIAAKDVILFIDEMHILVGAGAAEGAVDAANILKPALSRGELQVIGATTIDEYRKNIEKDAALERRFQSVMVCEPSERDAFMILLGLRDKYEAHHKIKITDEAIHAAVAMSSRYISDRRLPDKAIDLIDEAASRARMKNMTAPPDLKAMEDEIERTSMEKEEAVKTQDYERAASLRDTEVHLKSELVAARQSWTAGRARSGGEIREEDIAHVVAQITGIPVARISEDEASRLAKLEDVLHERVIGQNEAVGAVSKAIRRGRVGLKDPKRPIGSFIFLGSTGVGKTELAKALAEAVFGDENSIIRVDMSEFMEPASVSKLVGAAPGYVGYDEAGQLTEQIRRKPYSVLLFDEIEKAHPDVFNILLQVLDDGHITDSHGRRIDFKNTIIIMTSNVGAAQLRDHRALGFGSSSNRQEKDLKATLMAALRNAFKPEFLNRIDDTIVFCALEDFEIRQIAGKMMEQVCGRLKKIGIDMEFEDSALDVITKVGYDPQYGARPLRRAIQSQVEDLAASQILDGTIKNGDRIKIGASDGNIFIERL